MLFLWLLLPSPTLFIDSNTSQEGQVETKIIIFLFSWNTKY